MKHPIALGLLFAFANAIETSTFQYMQYLSKFGKSHTTIEEFNLRLADFSRVDKFIEEWNSNPIKTSRVGHNIYSDWSTEERARLRKPKNNVQNKADDAPKHVVDLTVTIPSYWNWTSQGVVPDVGNQNLCSDCYAWSAVGAVEAALAIQNNGTNSNGSYTGNYFSVQ